MKLRAQVQELEKELLDVQSNYDREKALWEGKCNFMEQQKETYKKDLIESQKKFEITLEQLQKRGSIDKDKQENSQQALIRVLESKYSAKIRDLLDQHQQQLAEEKSKARRLEAELKALSDRLLLEQKGKQTEQVSLEKRVADLQETERRLQGEIEEMRQERDRRS